LASAALPGADLYQAAGPQLPAGGESQPRKPLDDFDAYNAATARLTRAAANELAACAYRSPPPILPKNHELRFCFPAPLVAMYRDLQTGKDIVLRRDKCANTFCKIGKNGWEPWEPQNSETM
jgi:hypothetical protein